MGQLGENVKIRFEFQLPKKMSSSVLQGHRVLLKTNTDGATELLPKEGKR